MPTFDFVVESSIPRTYRTEKVRGAFSFEKTVVQEHFKGEIAVDGRQWVIGLICGGSGTGKSSIAREVFGKENIASFEYDGNKAVIDEMPENAGFNEVAKTFTSVGFASVPSWLKPYSVLSNGEKMRVDIARMMLEHKQLAIMDEFTSVVDRTIAQVSSCAISKAIRRNGNDNRFVFVSCHKDIIDWLNPDWIYDTDERRFFFASPASGLESRCEYAKYKEKMQKIVYGRPLEDIII